MNLISPRLTLTFSLFQQISLMKLLSSWALVLILGVVAAKQLPPSFGHGAEWARSFRGHGVHARLQADHDESNEELYFTEAVVDNFNGYDDEKHWNQRYFMNDTFWGGPGPCDTAGVWGGLRLCAFGAGTHSPLAPVTVML
jgi:hypothetical protein